MKKLFVLLAIFLLAGAGPLLAAEKNSYTGTLKEFREEPQNQQIALVAYWLAVRSSSDLPQAVKKGEFSDAVLAVHECMAQLENSKSKAENIADGCIGQLKKNYYWLTVR